MFLENWPHIEVRAWIGGEEAGNKERSWEASVPYQGTGDPKELNLGSKENRKKKFFLENGET